MSQEYVDDCFDTSHAVQTDMGNIEKNFAALKSCFSGPSAPFNTVAGMWWYDTEQNLLKIRNEANTAWLSIWNLANNKPVIVNLSEEITDVMIATANKDGAAATPCMRRLGTGAGQAMPGNTVLAGIPSHIAVFYSSGTWAKPSDISRVHVKIWGGGGGAGYGGGGGGGGGYAEGIVQVTENVTVTIGGGGSGGDGYIRMSGLNGGSSLFVGTTTLAAYGGGGGGSGGDGYIGGSGGGANLGGITDGVAISGTSGTGMINIGTYEYPQSLFSFGGDSPMGGGGGLGRQGGFPGGGGGSFGGNIGSNGAGGLCIIMW